MVDVFGYLQVCVVSGRGFAGGSQGLGRLGNHTYAVQVRCDNHVWQTRAASPSGKSGVVQWGDSTTLKCVERLPQSLNISIQAEGILRKKEEVGESAYDLRQTVAEGQSVATIQLKKGIRSWGEIYIQVSFTGSSPGLKPPVLETRSLGTYKSWQPSPTRRASSSGQGPATGEEVYSPLGCALAQIPDSTSSFQPASRIASQLSVPQPPQPPRHLLSRQLFKSGPDTSYSQQTPGSTTKAVGGREPREAPTTSGSSTSQYSHTDSGLSDEQLERRVTAPSVLAQPTERQNLLASFGAWMLPTMQSSPAAVQQTAPQQPPTRHAGVDCQKEKAGGRGDPLRRKTRLEEELMQATDPGDCKPSAPPLDFTILAHR